jgi:hypothetical protein
MAVNRIYCATALLGGAEGALDTIDGADLIDKDMAVVCDQTTFYFFVLDADSAAAESSPDVISPDDNADDKRWILQSIRANDLTVSDDIILVADDIAIGGTATFGGTTITDGVITDDGTFTITTSGTTVIDRSGVAGSTSTLEIGVTDDTRGQLTLFADNNTSGGIIKFEVCPDQDGNGTTFYQIKMNSNTDDLHIGADNDTDMLTFLGGATPTIQATCAVDVGGTVITDATITDDGILSMVPTTSVDITGGNRLNVGANHTANGLIVAYGTAATTGGDIRCYFAADSDTNSDYFKMAGNGEKLDMGLSNDQDMFQFVGGGTPYVKANCTFNITGANHLIMGDTAKFEWDPSPSSDATMSGDIISQTVDANASGIGALLYKAADGNWEEADADAAATMGMLGIAVQAGTGTKDVLLRGFVKDTAWGFTPGQQLFASTTTGAITATAPSGSGDIVQVVGYAFEATVMYFNPSPDFIEIA